MKVDPIIRGGIRRFTDMIGQLWCSLADYYIRAGHFEKVHILSLSLSLTLTLTLSLPAGEGYIRRGNPDSDDGAGL